MSPPITSSRRDRSGRKMGKMRRKSLCCLHLKLQKNRRTGPAWEHTLESPTHKRGSYGLKDRPATAHGTQPEITSSRVSGDTYQPTALAVGAKATT